MKMNLRKTICGLMAAMMVCSVAIPVFAADIQSVHATQIQIYTMRIVHYTKNQ